MQERELSHKLSFGTIIILNEHLAEVIIDEGVEMDKKLMEEYHNFLLENLTSPFSLLVNKLHSYSYTFDVQRKISKLKEVFAVAVVVNSIGSKMATKTILSLNNDENWTMKMFYLREEALIWLNEEKNKRISM